MKDCYVYLRTSGDDGRNKQGIPVQRDGCRNLAQKIGLEVLSEYIDDGVTGKLPMSARPAGKLMIAALLAEDVKIVVVYDAKRVGRTQPAFWSFIGFCRDAGIAVMDAAGTDLCESVQGGIGALMSEMDRNAIVARLAAGKALVRGSKRVNGRHPFGQHPSHDYDRERDVVRRITEWNDQGVSKYRICWALNAEGVLTRCGKPFRNHMISRILKGKEETKC